MTQPDSHRGSHKPPKKPKSYMHQLMEQTIARRKAKGTPEMESEFIRGVRALAMSLVDTMQHSALHRNVDCDDVVVACAELGLRTSIHDLLTESNSNGAPDAGPQGK